MKKFFVKALAVLLVCLFAISGINFSIIADDSTDASAAGPGEKLVAVNIAIRGKINLLFYFENVSDIAYFKVGLPQADGTTSTVKVSKSWLQYDELNERYELRVPIAAALLAQDVTVQAFDKDGNAGKLHTYSIKDYANKLFAMNVSAGGTYDRAVKTVRAMLNYGAMARAYFLGNSSGVENPNSGLYYRGTNPVDGMTQDNMTGIVAATEQTRKGNAIKFTSVNAYLEDMVSLRFYFDYTGTVYDAPEKLTVIINGVTYKNEVIRDEQGKYYVLINNIPSSLFDKQYKVHIEESSNSYAEISYSVFNYLQAMFGITKEKQFADVAYSMFQFYAWTNEFAGKKGIIPTDCAHGRAHVAITSLAGAETLETATVCSDCGATLNTAAIGKFEYADGTITTDSLTYSVSFVGGNGYEVNNEYGITGIDKGETLTMSITKNSNTVKPAHNRFQLNYYASAPVKLTMKYKTGEESYYLEAGENVFSAVEVGFPSSSNSTALSSITVEPLTDTVDFVLFSYSTENIDTSSLDKLTYSVGGKNIDCYIQYLGNDNTRYKLGINLTWGGAISELYDNKASDTKVIGKNLVNNFDVGRLIQQSYYGTKDYDTHYWRANDSLEFSEWHYNPVQAGDAINSTSRIIDYNYDATTNCVYVKAQPRDWATYDKDGKEQPSRYTECYVENWYTLSDDYIQVDNRMVDFSGYTHPITTQELPAFYTLSYFNDYYWYNGTAPWTNDKTNLKNATGLPFWGDPSFSSQTTFNYQKSNTETWAAFVNSGTGYGIGLYVPNADTFKGGIVNNQESDTDASSSNTSYFAPLKELQIVCYEPIEYSYLICTGSVDEIRSTFKANKDFTTNCLLNNNSISKKLPDDPDMTMIDFSKKENLLFINAVNDATFSYDNEAGAIKFTTTATSTISTQDGDIKVVDSYFSIDYTMCQDIDNQTYPTDGSKYYCLEFEYMIPAEYAGKASVTPDLFFETNKTALTPIPSFVTLVADGEWHVAKYYIQGGLSEALKLLRVDFLNGLEDAAGQEFYLRSFGLTQEQGTVTGLSAMYSGQTLINEITNYTSESAWANKEGASASATICDGDYVRLVVGSVEDRHVGFDLGGEKATGKYMVIKYRTDALLTYAYFHLFATVDTNTIHGLTTQDVPKDCEGSAPGLVSDGKWHTLVVDLSQISENVAEAVKAGDTVKLNQVRIDLLDCFYPGSTVDIAYVGFCDSLGDVSVNSGEYVEYSSTQWAASIDSVKMDGASATKNSTNYESGANQRVQDEDTEQIFETIVEGSVWTLTGWFAVNGVDADKIEYCITEEDGTEHWITGRPVDSQAEAGENGYWLADQAVIDNTKGNNEGELGYTESTVPYRFTVQEDLRAYVGQTVTITARVIVDGYAAVIYAGRVKVSLPIHSSLDFVLTSDDLYLELFGRKHDTLAHNSIVMPKIIRNEDGTFSVTVTEKVSSLDSNGNKQSQKWIGIQPNSNTATGNYMVIRYRTSATPQNGMFYIYVATGPNEVKDETNSMRAYGFVGDGNWHTLVIDLSDALASSVSADYKYHISDLRLQMLDQLDAGEVIDFEYIGFCDNLNDIKAKENEYIDYSWQKWTAYVNGMSIDNQTIINNNPINAGGLANGYANNHEAGASRLGDVLNGTVWQANGWVAIDNCEITDISYFVTDENGVSKQVPVQMYESGDSRWYEDSSITTHATNALRYGSATKGYNWSLKVDLTEYAGQRVNLSVRALTNTETAVVIYSVVVDVPLSANPGWFDSTELVAAVRTEQYGYSTDGGYLTITKNSSGYDANGALSLTRVTTDSPRYAVIRYKTTDASTLRFYATTKDSNGNVLNYEPAREIALIKDGAWHVATIDLANINQYIEGNDLALLRLDVLAGAQGETSYSGKSFAIDYIFLCDETNIPKEYHPLYMSGEELFPFAKKDCYEVNLNDNDGTLTLTAKTTGDNYINQFDSLASGFAATRYAAIKYKTTSVSELTILASTGTTAGGPSTSHIAIKDGEWHVMIVDLTKCAGYAVGDKLNFLRINCCRNEKESVTIDYVLLFNDLGDVMPESYTNVDHVYVDDNQNNDLKNEASVEGSKIQFVGWAAVNGYSATALAYVVTDELGNETIVDYEGVNFNYTAATADVVGKGFLEHGTAAFNGTVTADLSAWAGQTVTLSLVAKISDGRAVEFYSIEVTVPETQSN